MAPQRELPDMVPPGHQTTAIQCPAAGPFGTDVGATVSDFALKDCDGNDVSIHGLCEYKAAWLVSFAPW